MALTQQNLWSMLKDNANNNIFNISGSGAPVNGVSGTGVGICGRGSFYIDIAVPTRYMNTGTILSPTWTSF